ncbi:MAG: hypothetical protein C4B59_02435 [Candidatus Methanogaster sp.]|uniref:Uncharacterized protein n=1 Tax=Candidatus Methanogaster sp. TaxID=3386292 RepID=A0AC61L5T6_9EURY|nr:MAG: hypothetical protein C4B59_02435 [ANME-2 cluster archaeon]
MNNRTTISILSVVLIAAVLSGCVQETSEIGTPQPNVTPPAATPDAAPPVSSEEILIYPEEFVTYQDYIKTIGGKPMISDIGTVEATIMSITKARYALMKQTLSLLNQQNVALNHILKI